MLTFFIIHCIKDETAKRIGRFAISNHNALPNKEVTIMADQSVTQEKKKSKECFVSCLFFMSLICLLPSLSYAHDAWTTKDTIYQGIFLAIHSIDFLQTKEIARNPNYHETNLFLGKYPSQGRVNSYFFVTAIFHTTIAYYLPKKFRRVWQYVFIGMQSAYVVHNYYAGIRIHF